jgi:hypothetical protein
MRVEIQVKSSYLSLGKKEQGTTEIDCQALFNDYWSSTAHEFPVRSQLESPEELRANSGQRVATTAATPNPLCGCQSDRPNILERPKLA